MDYYVFYKPYGVLSQFSDESGHAGLGQLNLDLAKDVYPVGRLDRDSEGLLLLSNDGALNGALLDPKHAHERTYWVQVEGDPSEQDLHAFERPMLLKIKGKDHVTAPARARLLPLDLEIMDREPPIRIRKSVPDRWIELIITEGKNRQVRKMTAHAGFPTLRLIRQAIGKLQLVDLNLQPGQLVRIGRDDLLDAVGLNPNFLRSQRTKKWDR